MDASTGKAGVIRASDNEGSMGKLVGLPETWQGTTLLLLKRGGGTFFGRAIHVWYSLADKKMAACYY